MEMSEPDGCVGGGEADRRVELDAFDGVFGPNLLTILGVIMFMRLGWVVGNAGLVQALWILVIANVITLLTPLSLSAISMYLLVCGGCHTRTDKREDRDLQGWVPAEHINVLGMDASARARSRGRKRKPDDEQVVRWRISQRGLEPIKREVWGDRRNF
jgi:hypothetical protein